MDAVVRDERRSINQKLAAIVRSDLELVIAFFGDLQETFKHDPKVVFATSDFQIEPGDCSRRPGFHRIEVGQLLPATFVVLVSEVRGDLDVA